MSVTATTATTDPIVNALRLARKTLKLSQQDVGQLIGRETYQTVWQWESGRNDPTLSNLRQWAEALGYELTLVPRRLATTTAHAP